MSLRIEGLEIELTGAFLKTASLANEWYEDVSDPERVSRALKESGVKADFFTFWQRLPDNEPRFPFYREWEEIAVLEIKSFEDWWKNAIKSRVRGLARKAGKKGVEVRETVFDDKFVRGMVEIFNETPVRQGRPFWHYGKDFETVKRQFSRFLFREDLIGAFLGDELIGFIMLADAGEYALLGQIISKVEHRDKAPNNALIAKAVELCARKGFQNLIYNYWNDTGLTEFKRRNGFVPQKIPRYFIPLSARGKVCLHLGLHGGLKRHLPIGLLTNLRKLRSSWYQRKLGS